MPKLNARHATLAALIITGAHVHAASAQTIGLSADSLDFVARVGSPNPPPQAIMVTNTGRGGLSWQITRASLAPWLSAAPMSGAAPDSVTFSVSIAGLRPGVYIDSVRFASINIVAPNKILIVVLTVGPSLPPGTPPPPASPLPSLPPLPTSGQYLAEYQVELIFTGYVGLVEGFPNCKVNQNGTDRLTGTLIGFEPPTPDEDVEYAGNLKRDTAIDFCETRGKSRPGDDERVWCVVTLTGATTTRVNLTVYGEADRGAFLKAVPAGATTKHATGNCDQPETSAALNDYPASSDGGAASPNGQPIEDAFSPPKFYVAGLARLRVGIYLADPTQGGWVLRVLRKIR